MARGRISAFFGKVVRKHRRRLGLSQEKLAELSKLHRTEISLVERGKRKPSLEVAWAIGDGLGIHVEDLLREARRDLRRARD